VPIDCVSPTHLGSGGAVQGERGRQTMLRLTACLVVIALTFGCGDPYVLNGYRSPMGVNGLRQLPHSGVDFKGDVGDPVIAAAPGIVYSAYYDRIAGISVLVRHSTNRYTAYLHLSAVDVVPGQCVRRGQKIGSLGATGSGSGGRPHVHLHLCDFACLNGTPDGKFKGVRDPMEGNAGCFVPGRKYDDSTLTYPIVCDGARGVPVRPDPSQQCSISGGGVPAFIPSDWVPPRSRIAPAYER